MADNTLTQEYVRELFDYRDGLLLWKIKRYKVTFGAEAGCIARRRGTHHYKMVRIDDRLYLVHRIIFLWHHGYLPAEIDHINRDRLDNRIENLRQVSRTGNRWNDDRVLRARGTTRTESGKWTAAISVGNKRRHLGSYPTEQEAHDAYLSARKELRGC